MPHNSYASLLQALEVVGLTGFQKNPYQLVVSSQQGPAWPDRGNSFWLSFQGNTWYLSTWLPKHYRIPPDQDVVAVCLHCMNSTARAMSDVLDEIVARFRLEKISDEEFERLFPEDSGGE